MKSQKGLFSVDPPPHSLITFSHDLFRGSQVAVKCPNCQAENPDAKQYCGDCGVQLLPSKDFHSEVTETLQTPIKELTTDSTFAGRYQIIEKLGAGAKAAKGTSYLSECCVKISSMSHQNLAVNRWRDAFRDQAQE